MAGTGVPANEVTGGEALARTTRAFEAPGDLAGALREGLAGGGPTVIDLVVVRASAKMLPGVDNRAARVKRGDRVA